MTHTESQSRVMRKDFRDVTHLISHISFISKNWYLFSFHEKSIFN